MRKILVTIPDDKYTPQNIVALESSLSMAYMEMLNTAEKPECFWSLLPSGQSYVAGLKDDIYVALVEVENGFDQSKREDYLLQFNKVFAEAFGLSIEKPLITFADSSKINEYMQANRNRLKSMSKIGFIVGSLVHAYRSRKSNGFSAIRTNL